MNCAVASISLSGYIGDMLFVMHTYLSLKEQVQVAETPSLSWLFTFMTFLRPDRTKDQGIARG